MASAVVASTSATTSPTSTAAPVARSEGGDLDREEPLVAAAASTGGGDDNNTASIQAESGGPNTLNPRHDSTSLMEINDTNCQHRQEQEQPLQSSQPLSEEIRPEEMIQVGDDYNAKMLSLSSSPLDPSIPARTVATSRKGFGEGPLPRELHRIILEVAKTGKCSWLSWSQETTTANSKRKGNRVQATASVGAATSAVASKSPSLAKVGSSSPNHYSPSFGNKGTSGGVVRKQPSFGGGSTATTASRRPAGLPPRKRHRNGVVHKGGERMRFGNADGAFGRSNASSNSRKRPLVRANSGSGSGNSNSSSNNNNTNSNIMNAVSSSSATPGGLYSSAPNSVGSGRSTGSEPEYDSAQYECDSEGTSASTSTEISIRKTTRAKRSGTANTQGAQINSGLDTWTDTATVCDGEDETNSVDGNNAIPVSPYKTLQTAFRGALGLVLDHFYQNRDNGYKLSPAEKRKRERFAETLNRNSKNQTDSATKSDKLASLLSSEYVFQQRRQRLMAMLLPTISQDGHEKQSEEPPFTIQRIAEVLINPDRYYTQTHKLCNCLEKLLLVNSSTDSFGGSTGGDTLQYRTEARELAALADEKGKQEFKLRQRRIANSKSPIDEFVTDDNNMEPLSASRNSINHEYIVDEVAAQNNSYKARSGAMAVDSEKEAFGSHVQSTSPSQRRILSASSDSTMSRELLEAARASLRSKFDHVETDLQQSIPNSSNERDVRPIAENRRMTNSPPLPGLSMAPGVSSGPNITLPSHGDANAYVRQQLSVQQQNEEHDLVAQPLTNMNMLRFHHAVALAGVPLNNRPNNPSPFDNLMTIDASTISQMRSHANTAGAEPGSESTDGRSSASNSDIDSESDDISFDDSASDRSDGSDSGSASAHNETFTAARARALNRMQQQQRFQSRVLTSLGTSHQCEGFRPPADSEYQSGDSIDSTRAEDSGGSDSSSSDLAD